MPSCYLVVLNIRNKIRHRPLDRLYLTNISPIKPSQAWLDLFGGEPQSLVDDIVQQKRPSSRVFTVPGIVACLSGWARRPLIPLVTFDARDLMFERPSSTLCMVALQVTDEDIVEHYRVVAAAADLPLFVYNLPQVTQVEITSEHMAKIQENVQLVGLEHSSFKFIGTHYFAQMGFVCLTGNGPLMLPSLTVGASGCVDGALGLAPEIRRCLELDTAVLLAA